MWRNPIHFDQLELLGEGGQGSVYKALRRDRAAGLEQLVALKILHSKTAVDLWRREFESLSRVQSKYCVRVLSFERVHRQPALVLEFIDGVSLSDLGQTCLLDEQDRQEIGAQTECGLKDLHSQGMFHGDLSPQNILVDRFGNVRLLDFGLANAAPGAVRVTPEFAAPERLQGAPVSVATDLYSLGRVLDFVFPMADDGQYLQIEPSLRRTQNNPPHAESQARLANKVEAYLLRKGRDRDVRTQTQIQTSGKSWSPKLFVLGTIASFLLLTTSTASQIKNNNRLAQLNVRTAKWHYFIINGTPVGYAPFSLPIVAGQNYRLEWRSANGRGARNIVLSARETRSLEDRDFSH